MKKKITAAMLPALILILAAAGCSRSGGEGGAVLIQVGESRMTTHEFSRCLHVSLSAYPNDFETDQAAFTEFKKNLFRQMVERMVMIERARELDIRIQDAEVENAVAGMQAGMSEKKFRESLLESNITFDDWKEELKIRLLIEKVTARELGQAAGITQKEIALYYQQLTGSKTPVSADALPPDQKKLLADQIRRLKMERAFDQWIEQLKKRYVIASYPEKLRHLAEY